MPLKPECPELPDLDLGFLVTGKVKFDPYTGHFVLIVEGESIGFDTQEALKKYEGKEVRFTLASLESIATMTALVENGSIPLPKADG